MSVLVNFLGKTGVIVSLRSYYDLLQHIKAVSLPTGVFNPIGTLVFVTINKSVLLPYF